MQNWKKVALAVFVAVICAPATLLKAADDPTSGPALALRLTELAQRTLHMESAPSDPAWREAVALLKAARELDPEETRYLRLLADAQVAMHDKAGALETLTTLRAVQRKTQQEDQVAQLEYIDLVIDRMQTVDEKLKYLRGLVPNDVLSPEVRSAVAWRCAVLLNEKKQTSEAGEMVSQALTLNPVNWPALYYRFQETTANGSRADRVDALLALMRSNPCKPDLVFQLAQELAAAGMVTDALKWYDYAGRTWAKMHQNPPIPALLEVASEMFLGDQPQQAQPIVESLIGLDAENYPALVLRLLIEKNGGTKEAADKIKNQARNALVNDVAIVRGKLGVKEATTQPVGEGALPAPDLGGDVVRVKESKDARLRDDYLQAVGNLAWFELYFNGQIPEADRLLGVIRAAADAQNQQTSTFIARMEGWLFLLRGNKSGEAKVKLSAVADKDAFAALGLVRLYAEEDKAKARAEAVKLLSANGSGMLGAMLYFDLRELGVKVAPREDGAKLKASLDKFPARLDAHHRRAFAVLHAPRRSAENLPALRRADLGQGQYPEHQRL
jgi:tetratricopeptide (TPR) repeat protein